MKLANYSFIREKGDESLIILDEYKRLALFGVEV